MKILLNSTIALALIGTFGNAQACSTSQWSNATAQATSITAGGVRYEGLCALKATTGQSVEKTIAGSGDSYFRFYVYPTDSQTADVKIFSAKAGAKEVAVSLGAGDKLKVGSGTTDLPKKKWSSVEVEIKGNVAKVWVNGDEKLPNVAVTGGNIDKIALGALSGTLKGTLYFDSFVASNGQRVGKKGVSIGSDKDLVPGDADGNAKINAQDVFYVKQEIFASLFGNYSGKEKFMKGIPDRDNNGKVDAQDVFEIKKKIFDDLFGN